MKFKILLITFFFNYSLLRGQYVELVDSENIESLYSRFENGYQILKKDKFYALANREGKKMTEFNFLYIRSDKLVENLILCQTRDYKYGFIDFNGNVIIPFVYDFRGDFFLDKTIIAYKNKLLGVLDIKGNEILPFKFSEITRLDNKMYLVRDKESGLYGIISSEQKEVIPLIYEELFPTKTDMLLAKKANNKWVSINYKNEILASFSNIGGVVENYQNGHFKLSEGLLKLPNQFVGLIDSNISNFTYSVKLDLILAERNYLWGAYDFKLNLKIPIIQPIDYKNYESLESIKYDLENLYAFVASINGKYGLNNLDNINIVPYLFDKISIEERRYFILKKGNQVVFFDSKSKNLSGTYNSVYINNKFSNLIFHVEKQNKRGILNHNLEVIVPCEYENIDIGGKNKDSIIYFNAKNGGIIKRFENKE